MHIDAAFFILGIIAAAMSSLLFGLIMMAIAISSFWVGLNDATEALFDFIWSLSDYPTTIYPMFLQTALVLVMPVFFAQTFPAMMASGGLSIAGAASLFALMALLTVAWWLIVGLAWRYGLRRYSSYGG
jgi:ABC-2 type transport system permease protein